MRFVFLGLCCHSVPGELSAGAAANGPLPIGSQSGHPADPFGARLLAVGRAAGLGTYVAVTMATGARPGDLCALRWRDVHLRHARADAGHACAAAGCGGHLVLGRAVAGPGGRVVVRGTTAVRAVGAPADLVGVLLAHRAHQGHVADAVGLRLVEDAFVFAASPDGSLPCVPAVLARRFAACAARAGVQASLGDLRRWSIARRRSGGSAGGRP